MLPGIQLIQILVAVALGATTLTGAALIWATRALEVFHRRATVGLRLLRRFGWLLFLVGGAVATGSLLITVTPVAVLLASIVFLLSWGWKRRGDRRQLLWAIGTAARGGLPLAPAIRALAEERGSMFHRRLQRLANALDQGIPLPQAVTATIGRTTADGDVELAVCHRFHALADILPDHQSDADATDVARLKVMESLLYFAALFCLLIQMLLFSSVYLLPQFQAMLREFGITRLPRPLGSWIRFVQWLQDITPSWALGIVFGNLIILIVLFIVLIFLHHLHVMPRNVWLVSRLGQPLDRARILEALALIVQRGESLPEGLRFLADIYPKRLWRSRLQAAARAINAGQDWAEGLRAGKILSPGQLALARAGAGAGNLAWVFRELAGTLRRRYTFRLRLLIQTITPVVIVVFGLLFGCIALLVFVPLTELILQNAIP